MGHALRVHTLPGELQFDDIPDPVPGPDEELVDLDLISVNPLDVWVTQGTVAGGHQRLPHIPGSEALGRIGSRSVICIGSGLGTVRPGLYAERQAVPRAAIVEVAGDDDHEQAAVMGVAGRTAWSTVHDLGAVQAGEDVLVLGASGGVGSLAAQLCVAAGAVVYGQTGSAVHRDAVERAGAHPVLARSGHELVDALGQTRPALVIDGLGGEFTAAALLALAAHGRLVLYGTSAGPVAQVDLRDLYRKYARLLTLSGIVETADQTRYAVQQALAAMRAGHMHAHIDEVLPLAAGAEAHRRILERRVRGKLLLRP